MFSIKIDSAFPLIFHLIANLVSSDGVMKPHLEYFRPTQHLTPAGRSMYISPIYSTVYYRIWQFKINNNLKCWKNLPITLLG